MLSKEERIERIQKRIERLEAFSKGKDISLYSEERSGIPLGQPILVGHHSERRHRRHLERIDRLIRQGFDAQKKIESLKDRIEAIKHNKNIYSDDPNAIENLKKKLQSLMTNQEMYKRLNSLVRKAKGNVKTLEELILTDDRLLPKKKIAKEWALELLTPDFAGRIGIADYILQNNNANIRRIKKRIEELEAHNSKEFEDFSVKNIDVVLRDNQIQVHFPFKPNEEIRTKLKSSPLALKWSRFSKAWVRKYTPSIGEYFITELKKVLESC